MIAITAGATNAFDINDIRTISMIYTTTTPAQRIIAMMVVSLKNGQKAVWPFDEKPEDGKELIRVEFNPDWLPKHLGEGDD